MTATEAIEYLLQHVCILFIALVFCSCLHLHHSSQAGNSHGIRHPYVFLVICNKHKLTRVHSSLLGLGWDLSIITSVTTLHSVKAGLFDIVV